MRIAFLILAALCGVLLSVLTAVFQTGRMPLRDEARPEHPTQQVVTATSVRLLGEEALNELIAALGEQRTNYVAKTRMLDDSARETEVQKQVIAKLTAELKQLHAAARQSIVELELHERSNLRRLAEVYGRMEPESAVMVLSEMETERAGKLLSMIGERPAAAILSAAVTSLDNGSARAAEWSDIMRRLKTEANGQKRGT